MQDTSIVEHYRANRIFARDMYRVCIFLINYCNSSHFGGGLDFVQIYLMRCRERKVGDIMQSDFGNIYVHNSQQIWMAKQFWFAKSTVNKKRDICNPNPLEVWIDARLNASISRRIKILQRCKVLWTCTCAQTILLQMGEMQITI